MEEKEKNQNGYDWGFKRVSNKGKTFKERGLYGGNLNTLRAAMKRVSLDILLDANAETIYIPEGTKEYIIMKADGSCSKTEGYFYLIRNAFAHGNFEIENTKKGRVYNFSNYS